MLISYKLLGYSTNFSKGLGSSFTKDLSKGRKFINEGEGCGKGINCKSYLRSLSRSSFFFHFFSSLESLLYFKLVLEELNLIFIFIFGWLIIGGPCVILGTNLFMFFIFKFWPGFISVELVSVNVFMESALLRGGMERGEEDGMSQWDKLRIPSVEPGADIFW